MVLSSSNITGVKAMHLYRLFCNLEQDGILLAQRFNNNLTKPYYYGRTKNS
jgi:hypothetical protein